LIDFILLIGTQTNMVLPIVQIYQHKITAKQPRELIDTFGLGLLARALFQQFSKFGPVTAWILSSGIGTSMTVVMS